MSASLPGDWQVVYPDDVVSEERAIVSGPFGSSIGKRFFVRSGIPVIRGNNLTLGENYFIDDGFVFLTEEKAKQFKNCQAVAGDIVFTAAGTLGQVGVIPRQTKYPVYIISNKQLRLRPDPKLALPKYLYYWFSSKGVRNYIVGLNTGASVPLITLGKLRSIPINLPPLPIQHKIAGVLSAYDDLIENNSRRIKILEEIAQRIYREWFVDFRYPGHENQKLVESPLGKIPETWEVGSLGNVADLKKERFKEQEHSYLPLLDLARIPRKSCAITDFGKSDEITTARIVFQEGDILFGAIRPYFHKVVYCPIDGVTNTSVFVIKPQPHYAVTYLFSLLFSDQTVAWAAQYSGGTKMPVIKWDVFKNMVVALPPKECIERFDSVVRPMVDEIVTFIKKNVNLRQTRDLLLPKLISGKIDVSDLDIEIGGRDNE